MRLSRAFGAAVVSIVLVAGSAVTGVAVAAPVPAPVSAAPESVTSVGGGAAASARSARAFARSVALRAQRAVAREHGTMLPLTSSKDDGVGARIGGTQLFGFVRATRYQIATSEYSVDPWNDEWASVTAAGALRKELARRGLKRTTTGKGKNAWIYTGRAYVCQVSGPGVACVTRAQTKKAAAAAKPIITRVPGRYAGATAKHSTVKAGATRGYSTAELSIGGWAADTGNVQHYLYKRAGGRWTYVTAGQRSPDCDAFEASTGARKAFAGLGCYRGDTFSTVRR